MSRTEKKIISFSLDAKKVSALDALGKALNRDRTSLLNEAVGAYLEEQPWQLEHVKAALRQADQGNLLEHAEIRKRAAKWQRL